jgi:phosphate uptake regulator
VLTDKELADIRTGATVRVNDPHSSAITREEAQTVLKLLDHIEQLQRKIDEEF